MIESHESRAAIRVLIVDDHEIARAGIRTLLEIEPDFAVVADTGTADDLDALVTRHRADVVLLDVRLPGVSGPEACRQLGVTHPVVAVIMITTWADDHLVDECIKAGARGYVLKDIDRFDLKTSIRTVHRGGGFVAPVIAGRLLDRIRTSAASGPAAAPTQRLTEQQRAILRLVSDGLSNREIGQRVYLSENTVKSHLQEIFRKLEVRNRVEAALRAAKEGWL